MRVREMFDLDYLELYQGSQNNQARCNEILALAVSIRDFIASQGDLRDNTGIEGTCSGSKTILKEKSPACFSMSEKFEFEKAPDAMSKQLQHLEKNAPELFESLVTCAGKPITCQQCRLDEMKRTARPIGGSRQQNLAGKYQHESTGQLYYVKCPLEPEHARNEVLMSKLASLMGLRVPDYRLHQEQGKTFVISPWQEGLKPVSDFSKRSKEELALLYIGAAWLGNSDTVYHQGNTLEGADGQLVSLDWGVAGRFNASSKRKSDFFSAPIELAAFKDANTQLSKKYFEVRNEKCASNHQNAFGGLTDNDVINAVRRLINVPSRQIDELIETYGPDKPGERQWLRRTIHERRAWFALRYPQACDEQIITPAEQGAISSAGINGYCRPVCVGDIAEGQIRLQQQYTPDGQAQIQASLLLSEEAAVRLESEMGIVHSHHNLRQKIAFFRNYVSGTSMSEELRQEHRILTGECQNLIANLDKKTGSYRGVNGELRENLEQWLSELRKNVQETKDGELVNLKHLPELAGLTDLHCLPGRVATVGMELPGTFSVIPSLWSQGALTGERCQMGNSVPAYTMTPDEKTTLSFHGAAIPTGQAFARRLTVTVEGSPEHAAEKLFSVLEGFSLHISRPSAISLQEEYLDQLARFEGIHRSLDQQVKGMAEEERVRHKEHFVSAHLGVLSLSWEHHCLMEGGQRIFFRPPMPVNSSQKSDHYASHDLGYFSGDSERKAENVIDTILHKGGTLDSLPERSRKGLPTFGSSVLDENIENGAATLVFSRLGKKKHHEGIRILLKPRVLERLDAMAFGSNAFIRDRAINIADSDVPLTKKMKLERTETRELLTNQEHEDKNHVNYAHSVSLYENLEAISVPDEQGKARLTECLKKHFDYWPDGRPVDEVVLLNKYSYAEYERLCKHKQWGQLVKSLGYNQFKPFLQLNPDLEKSGISSLNGLELRGCLEGFSFKGIDLKNTVFSCMKIENCNLTGCDLSSCTLYGTFINCQFDDGNQLCFTDDRFYARFVFSHLVTDTVQCNSFKSLLRQVDRHCSCGLETGLPDFDKTYDRLLLKDRVGLLKYQALTDIEEQCLLEKAKRGEIIHPSECLWQKFCNKHCFGSKEESAFINQLDPRRGFSLLKDICSDSIEDKTLDDILIKYGVDIICELSRDYYDGKRKFFSMPKVKSEVNKLMFIPQVLEKLIDTMVMKSRVNNLASLVVLFELYNEAASEPLGNFEHYIDSDSFNRSKALKEMQEQWQKIKPTFLMYSGLENNKH
ncbi:pentapeptide repeat-containing protein [Endozoicomonas numazuensis]|nr:pentapeptide repeat-containing protein [Endozoicomonas numazuensis]